MTAPTAAPRVSVVIPAYNAAAFIERTLASVLAQDLTEHEVIVVDDGSADSTAQIAARFGPPVHVIGGPRRGVSEARNEGVRRARGEYIAFLDHDDLWEPSKLRRQVEIMESNPEAGLVFTQAQEVTRGIPGAIFPSLPDPARFLKQAYENLVHWNYIPMSAVMARRSRMPDVKGGGPFDPRFALSEDWDLWLRIASRHEVVCIAEPLTQYVIVPGRATERMADMRLEDLVIFKEQIERHPWLQASDPVRCAETSYRLHREAGYWLLKEGRKQEARPLLAQAWRLRPAAVKTLAYLAASLLPRGGPS